MPAAGVYKKEVDLSLFIEIASELKVGLVGPFNKGPINERTLITNNSALEETFGKPIDDDVLGQGFFAAREYLKNGNQAWVVRAESEANPAVAGKTGVRSFASIDIAVNTDGATSIPATRTLTSSGSSFVTAGVLAGDILEVNEGSADDGWYIITNVAATVLTIDRDWPTGSLSGLDFVVHACQRVQYQDGATSAQASRTFTSLSATFVTNGVAPGDILRVFDSIDPDDNGAYAVESVTNETTLVVNRNWVVGNLTNLNYIVYGPLHPQLADGSTATDGEFLSVGAQFQLHGVQAGDLLVIEDTTDTDNNGTYVIEGLKTGSEATTLLVNVDAWPGGSLTNLTYRVFPSSVTFEGNTKGSWVNGYQIRAVHGAEATLVNIEVIDNNGFVLETLFNVIPSEIEDAVESSPYITGTYREDRAGFVQTAVGTFNGGEDGTTGLTDADLLGNSVLRTGLQAFQNIEEVEIDVLLIPGYTSQNIGDGLQDMCERTRGDCMFIPDPPDYPTISNAQEIIDWQNGTGGYGRTTAFNTSYGALYWSWCQIFDPFHNKDRWTAPSGHAVSVWAQSENQTYPWFAPAGTRRGIVRGASDVRLSPDPGQRTMMQVGENVNPIVKFIRDGIVIYGQKTLLRTNSALNRINVRRMVLFAERTCLNAIKPLVFDPNDIATDRELVRLVSPGLQFIQDNRGLREYLVIADESTSPPEVRANNKLISKIFIKPTTTAEIIELQFILTAQNANFEELLAA